MVTQKNQLFRKEALEKVASPEQLDQLIKITSPKRWFSLFALGSLVAAGLTWSILGRIPIIVTGRGVLIYPSKVVTVQASNPGRILELNVEVGEMVKKGQILATIDQSELKKQLQLSRDKLAQFGAIAAQESSAKLVNVVFLPVSEGKKIKPGMSLQITPSTVKREEFGGIEAKVTNISAFPVTQQGAVSLIGNADILPSVLDKRPQLAVFTELQPDSSTFSKYRWSSSTGPQLKMTPGTTTSVRITVEQKKPIEFVLPILKDWSGIG